MCLSTFWVRKTDLCTGKESNLESEGLVSTFVFVELYEPAHFLVLVFFSSPILHLFKAVNLRLHKKN